AVEARGVARRRRLEEAVRRGIEPLTERLEDRVDERVLVREVVEERRLVDAHALGEEREAQPRVAAVGVQAARLGDDPTAQHVRAAASWRAPRAARAAP